MNEDKDLTQQDDPGVGAGKIFDITPDLNISPVSEDEDMATVATPATPIPVTPASMAPIPGVTIFNNPIKASVKPAAAITPPTPVMFVPPIAPVQAIPTSSSVPVAPSIPSIPAKTSIPTTPPTIAPVLPTAIKAATFTPPTAVVPPVPIKPLPTSSASQGTGPASAPTSQPASPQPYKTADTHNGDIKPLRTYEGDVAEVLAQRKASAASIAIAQQTKKGEDQRITNAVEAKPKRDQHRVRKLLTILACLVLVGAGIGGGYYLYTQSPFFLASVPPPVASTTPQIQQLPSLVPADSQAIIYIDGLSQTSIASRIENEIAKPQTPDTIKNIVIAETVNGVAGEAPTADMLSKMSIPAPDIIARTLSPQWMLGVYADASGNKSLFVVVKTDFFQNAFAGMLQWEKSMPQDIQQYLPAPIAVTIAPVATASTTGIATTTASSTLASPAPAYVPVTQQYFALQGQFEDRIIKNVDAREFVATSGNSLFLYSFVNNSTLVVAGSENALSEIITRLEQQAFVR